MRTECELAFCAKFVHEGTQLDCVPLFPPIHAEKSLFRMKQISTQAITERT